DANKKDDAKADDSKLTRTEQDIATPMHGHQPTTVEKPSLEPKAPTETPISTAETHDDEDAVMAPPRPADVTMAASGESDRALGEVGKGPKQNLPPPIHEELNSHDKELSQSMTEDGPQGFQPQPPSPRQHPSDSSLSASRPSPVQSLPPLSSISTTPSPFDVSQGSTRPSRSSMSVSALLVNNDDDSEQELDHGQSMSRSIFDQFETSASPTASLKSAHPSTQPTPAIQQLSIPHTSSTIPQILQSSGQTPLSSVSPRSGPGAVSVHRVRDTAEIPSPHPSQPGYSRTTAESNHTHGRGQELAKISPNKDYPADEAMESGVASGYGLSRHRLASPVGVRPLQDSVNGTSGGGPTNSKLPGVGSMTGLPPTPVHDSHTHSGSSYRNDATHPPLSSRPNSYSPTQHATVALSTNANGQIHYPSVSHSGHSSGIPPAASMQPPASASSTIVGHHPKLIVKNDQSLTTDGRPELFLGYYRYEPTLLLPSMEGKENSSLEVRVASPYLTYDNIKVKKRELWGTDIYTDDSDVVAMLIHAGYFIPPINIRGNDQDSIQPDGQQHNFAAEPIKHICPSYDLAVTLRVLPTLIKYQGSIRNRIKSRTWNSKHDGQSLRIESVRKLCPGEALNRGRSQIKRRMKEYNQERLRVLSNIHDETTESLQNERAMRTATFEFTHQGDPCFKYSPELVMDRHDGLSRKWTSWRLKKEVLILENDEERYEISLQHQAGTDARRFDQYRFAVISPRTSLSSWSKATYPLNQADLTEVLYEDLDWQDFEWVERGVVVQPSPRSKQSAAQGGPSSLMEGIESADKDLKHTAPTGSSPEDVETMAMEVEDEEAKNIRYRTSKSKTGEEVQGTLEVQQDGVFCVVSRLSWRPRSEQHSTRTTGTGSSFNVEEKTTRDSEKPLSTESQPQYGSKRSVISVAPLSSMSGSKPSQEQMGSSTDSSDPKPSEDQNDAKPVFSSVQNGQRDAEKDPSVPGGKESASGSDTTLQSLEPISTSPKPASSVSEESAMDLDTIGTRVASDILDTSAQPQQTQQQQQQQEQEQEQEHTGHTTLETRAPPSASESSHVEREEGELEEGEIASD
ncbi:hypothetical protein BGZ65_004880, partial [Modicella reniformis]